MRVYGYKVWCGTVIRFGMVRVGEVGQVEGQIISVGPLWAYAENFIEIHQDLAEI